MDSLPGVRAVKQPTGAALAFTMKGVGKEWREKSSTGSPRDTTR